MQGERERGVDAELVKVDLMNEDDEAYLNPQDRSEVATYTLHPTPYALLECARSERGSLRHLPCLGLITGGGCGV